MRETSGHRKIPRPATAAGQGTGNAAGTEERDSWASR
jgi:hypothetical protein